MDSLLQHLYDGFLHHIVLLMNGRDILCLDPCHFERGDYFSIFSIFLGRIIFLSASYVVLALFLKKIHLHSFNIFFLIESNTESGQT